MTARAGRDVCYVRMYTDAAGETRVQDFDVELGASSRGPISRLSSRTTDVIYRRSLADRYIGWRPPRSQFAITLPEHAEAQAGNGEIHRIGPGTVMLADDTRPPAATPYGAEHGRA